MSPERTLGQLRNQLEDGGQTGEMLRRIEEQFGGHFTLDPKVVEHVLSFEQVGNLTRDEKARLFKILTSGQGMPSTHLSGKFRGPEKWIAKQKIGSRYLRLSRRARGKGRYRR